VEALVEVANLNVSEDAWRASEKPHLIGRFNHVFIKFETYVALPRKCLPGRQEKSKSPREVLRIILADELFFRVCYTGTPQYSVKDGFCVTDNFQGFLKQCDEECNEATIAVGGGWDVFNEPFANVSVRRGVACPFNVSGLEVEMTGR
jgi:hypothetical protein